jgi:hypothetical protein
MRGMEAYSVVRRQAGVRVCPLESWLQARAVVCFICARSQADGVVRTANFSPGCSCLCVRWVLSACRYAPVKAALMDLARLLPTMEAIQAAGSRVATLAQSAPGQVPKTPRTHARTHVRTCFQAFHPPAAVVAAAPAVAAANADARSTGPRVVPQIVEAHLMSNVDQVNYQAGRKDRTTVSGRQGRLQPWGKALAP